MRKYLFTLLFICLTPNLFGQPEHFTRDRSYDVLHYKLNITIDEKNKSCSGETSIRLVPLRPATEMLMINAPESSVASVRIGGSQLRFNQSADSLTVFLNKMYGCADTLTLTISYSVTSPQKGLYFVSPDSGYPNKHEQVWSQGAAEDNHYWFPCYDSPNDRATSEMIVTVNEKFTAVSNGKLIEAKNNPAMHTTTYHWFEAKPHPSYLISLAVCDYAEVKDLYGDLPISNYVYPEQKQNAVRSFQNVPKMIKFFEKETGIIYPWEKFGHVVVDEFMFGGMENTSVVTLTDKTIHDARAHLDFPSDGLVAHELVHQWYGDMITCKDWSHAWLNEGFATYFENLYREYSLGKDEAEKSLMEAQTGLRNLDDGDRKRPMVCNKYNYPMDLFDSRIYGKGAVVLNMLRDFLGDELFFKSIKLYTERNAFRSVETNDFKNAIEEATGYNLHWFFDQWIYKAGCPEFDITTRWDKESRKVILNIKQIQKTDSLTGLFRVPVDIEIWLHGSPTIYRVMIEKKEEVFSFDAYQEPQLIIFDRGSKILKKIHFEKPLEQWIYQLKNVEAGVDRLLAIDELRWYVSNEAVAKVLADAALSDRFWAVREDALWALGEAKLPFVIDTLITAYGDIDSRVRRASIGALGQYRDEKVVNTLRYAFVNDSSYLVAATALRSLVKVDTSHAAKYLSEAMARNSHSEIIRQTALRLLGERTDDNILDSIISQTKYGVEHNLRVTALDILIERWKEREDVFFLFLNLINDPSREVRSAVIRGFKKIGDERSIEPLKKRLTIEKNRKLEDQIKDAIINIQEANIKE
ncbi:MAG: HEAT repeat domain-containing protein [Ignavibacteriales bacterium]|nr:HEAT repeat domain-containing protein [Ignavibacteriales bacterium]